MGMRNLSAQITSEWCMTISKSSSLPSQRNHALKIKIKQNKTQNRISGEGEKLPDYLLN
ncbi:hypothetical protein NC653_005733 [Populus alba x Populus x berolinensis]|uniref:Uncharacterized protein n=1 Tax=Populus alba x Populus x berolinensis TaxID=444605 RepID=A0AAD6RCX6_9ROSI|nr:hypothetical protein NC653_005733 [Populus alba x Populus x berolinensis]